MPFLPPNQQRQSTEGTTARTNEPVLSAVSVNRRLSGPTADSEYKYITFGIDRSGWLASRVVSVLDSGTEGHGFKSQPRRCRVTVLD